MTYNYIDSVDVSWETTGTNSSEAFLELYYYLEGDPWKLGMFVFLARYTQTSIRDTQEREIEREKNCF